MDAETVVWALTETPGTIIRYAVTSLKGLVHRCRVDMGWSLDLEFT